ncbi:MAG: hypothetical protein WC556_14775 [Candidatus Methanoperedens sp.]
MLNLMTLTGWGWDETKVVPDKWQFKFTSLKRRRVAAPVGSGVPLNTGYHRYITVGDYS